MIVFSCIKFCDCDYCSSDNLCVDEFHDKKSDIKCCCVSLLQLDLQCFDSGLGDRKGIQPVKNLRQRFCLGDPA